jgi:hypothetical protein
MTKSELKTGYIVTYRNGEKRTVFLNTNRSSADFLTDGSTYNSLAAYNEDLTCTFDSNRDIVKVEHTNNPVTISMHPGALAHLKTIWERPIPKKMTVSEIESILGYKIEIITEKEN